MVGCPSMFIEEFTVRAVKGRIPKSRRSDCKCGPCLDLKSLNAGWELNGELPLASHYSCVYWARYLPCLSRCFLIYRVDILIEPSV